MTITFTKALLSGVAAAIVATFAVAASAQTACAWPTMQGQCLPPPPGGSIISYPTDPWQHQPYVPGEFPGADTITLSR